MGHMTVGRRGSTAIVAAACLLGVCLSACEQEPTAVSANQDAPAADRAPTPLMGAPERVPPPPEAPPPEQAPSSGVIAMQPIPNPGDAGSGPYYDTPAPTPSVGRLRHRYAVAGGEELAPAPAHGRRHTYGLHSVAAPGAVIASGAGALIHPRPAAKTTASAATPKHPAAAPVPPPTPTGSQAERISGLTSAMAALLAKGAVLTGPDKFVLGAASDVVLTTPASFNDQLLSEAKSRGLQDEASAVSLSASLSGAGFGVMPAEAQSVLLAGGRASEFRWTVIQHDKAAGPLRATVSANLLGGGVYPMDLGAVDLAKTPDNGGFWRVAGGVLLILLGALAAAWLARSRDGARASVLADRAASNARRTPLDMSGQRGPGPPSI